MNPDAIRASVACWSMKASGWCPIEPDGCPSSCDGYYDEEISIKNQQVTPDDHKGMVWAPLDKKWVWF